MHLLTILIIIFLIIPVTLVVLQVYKHYDRQEAVIENATTNIGDVNTIEIVPIKLNGEWNVYQGVYIASQDAVNKLEGAEVTSLPLPEVSLYEEQGQRTYELFLETQFKEGDEEDVAIAIPFTCPNIRIYLNGVELNGFSPIKSWIGFEASLTLYKIEGAYDYEQAKQQLLISVNSTGKEIHLYRREIMVSTVAKFLEQTKAMDVIQSFFIGLMFISIIMGIVYIVIMPTYSVLTFMNIFDTTMMLSILYGVSTFPKILFGYFFSAHFVDALVRGQSLMFLFLSGCLGNILSQVIYDKEQKAPPIFWKPVNIIWCILAAAFAMVPKLFNNVMMVFTCLLLLFTFVGMLWRIWICYKSPQWSGYYLLHTCKTLFLGIVILYDVFTLNTYPRNNALIVTGYSIFFIMHFFIRAYEYRLPMKVIERHNQDLEEAVKLRTMQLSEANEVLREINIKDSLTKSFNRLYFEELLDNSIDQINNQESDISNLYLCVFDLDNFKTINDTYGHNVGDEQLIEAIKVLRHELPTEVIISRIGGEEFTFLFKDLNDMMVISMVEHARHMLEKLTEKEGRTTGSFGLTKFVKGETRKEFFIKADKCLYQSKNNGKNCITYNFYGEPQHYDRTSRQL